MRDPPPRRKKFEDFIRKAGIEDPPSGSKYIRNDKLLLDKVFYIENKGVRESSQLKAFSYD